MMEKWDNGKYRKARKMGGKKGFYFPSFVFGRRDRKVEGWKMIHFPLFG